MPREMRFDARIEPRPRRGRAIALPFDPGHRIAGDLESAKGPETRARRVDGIVAALKAGRRTR